MSADVLPANSCTTAPARAGSRTSIRVYNPTCNDPVVMAHARALLTSGTEGCCDYLHADLRDTEYVLGQAARTLDLTQPVAVLLLAVLHFIPDADDPQGIVAALARSLAPGSCVVMQVSFESMLLAAASPQVKNMPVLASQEW
jgi:hypothetical protein